MSEMLKQAELLAEMGYAVFPCRDPKNDPAEAGKKGKMPLTPNGVKDATIGLAQVDRWWSQWPTANIGLSCKNCLVIDIDNKDGKNGSEDFKRIAESLGPIDSVTVAATGSGGFHYFFARPDIDIVGQTGVEWQGERTGIDIRVGNQYIIAPPSLHESGKRYSWQKPLVPPEHLPPVPQAWIDGFLPKRDSKLVVPKNLATPIPDDKIVARCRKYVATMPEAVDGQGGHSTTLSVANAIFWGFGLDEQTGWPILLEYNQRCKPPWSEGELRHKMNEARDKPPNRDFCWLLNANRNRYQLGDFDYKNNEVEIVDDDEPSSVYPWHPFPVELLPETVSRFVTEVSLANGCDPAGVSIACLVALATAIGNSRRLRLKRGWVFPAILWGMLIARKGSIKSWALAPAIKPLDEVQAENKRQYDRQKAEYDRKKNEYQLLSPAQRRKEPAFDLKEPVLKRIISREATEQKLIKNCSENDRGLCVFTDELTVLLKGMGQYCKDGKGGNAQAMFNELFNGAAIESERIGESRYAPHAFVCIVGGIQPALARKCFDQESFESGFASRFIPVAPPLRVATWSDAVVAEETERSYCQLILAMLGLEMEAVWGAPNIEATEWNPDGGNMISVTGVPSEPESVRPILIETSPEALAIFKEFYDRTAHEMAALEDDNIRGAFEKLRTYAARLALIIHITRFMEQELFLKRNVNPEIAPWDRSTPRIDELECDAESMRIAVALADWFKYEVRRVYSTWGGLADETPQPKGDPLQQKIVEFMEQKRDGVTVRDLKRRFKSEKQKIEEVLIAMVEQGILVHTEAPASGPGRPRDIYLVATSH